MSSNRYTEVNWNQPISTYVPMPLDFIYKAGLQKQSQYDRALEESDKLQNLMTKVNAIDAHKEYKKQLADKYYGRINEIADKIVSKGDLSAQRDLNKIAREWQNDPVRQELEQSYANYAAYQKDKIAKGEKYAEWHDPTMSFIGHGEQGPNAFRYTGMLERTDHQKRAQDMMDKVAYDAAESAGFKINPDGTITKGGSGSEHILSQKIAELASMKVGDFLTTSEGQDFAKQLKYYNPQLSKEDLTKQATKYLYDAGANQIFNRSKSHKDVGFIPEWMMNQQVANNLTTTSQSENIANAIQNPIVEDMEFDTKGNLVVPTKKSVVKTGGFDEFGVWDPNKVVYGNEGKDLDKMAQQVKYIEDFKKQHPELKDLSPKATLETIKKAQKAVQSESIPLNSISNLAAKGIGEAIARNMNQRNFYLYDSKGVTQDGTRETVLKELGLTDAELQEYIQKNGISGYTQSGPTPGGLYVDIKDKDGDSRRIIISQDAELQRIFTASHAVNEARKTLTPTIVSPFPGYEVAIKPIINKDGSVKWEYMEVLNGKASKTSLDDIMKQEREALKESGYLGTQVQSTKDDKKEVN